MKTDPREPKRAPATVVKVSPQPDNSGTLRHVGGSKSDDWNNVLVRQTIDSLWIKNSQPEERNQQIAAVIAALAGFKPADELESMLAAQLISCHNAAMECFRRAMIGEQTFAGRSEARISPSRRHRAQLDFKNAAIASLSLQEDFAGRRRDNRGTGGLCHIVER